MSKEHLKRCLTLDHHTLSHNIYQITSSFCFKSDNPCIQNITCLVFMFTHDAITNKPQSLLLTSSM